MKKVDTKEWLEVETKKVISDTNKYYRDIRYKKELDFAVFKKILLMIPLLMIIVGFNMDSDLINRWFRIGQSKDVRTNLNTVSLFPNIWVCPKASCGYSNYDGISSCALCGTARP